MQVDEKIPELDTSNNNEEYEVEAIWDNAIYIRELESYLPSFYYLIA